MAFHRVQHQLAVDDILAQFVGALRSGSLAPGDRLPPEREWAGQLGVGRPTIREAIKVMASMGLVQTLQGSGTYVTANAHEALLESSYGDFRHRLTLKNSPLLQLVEARRQLEPAMAALAARRAGTRDIDRIEKHLQTMKEALDSDHARFGQADVNFHRAIASATRNRVMVRILAAISELLAEGQRTSGMFETARQKAIVFHEQLVEALRQGDAHRAARIMDEHLRDVETDMKRALKVRAASRAAQEHSVGDLASSSGIGDSGADPREGTGT